MYEVRLVDDRDIYPAGEERNILFHIDADAGRIPGLFSDAVDSVTQLLGPEDSRVSCVARRLYRNVLSAVFEKHAWLSLYLSPTACGASDGGGDAYCKALAHVVSFVTALFPAGLSGVLRQACVYVLKNPEAELRLPLVAERISVSPAHLGELFRQKAGVGFKEYVTTVRMFRARYLIEHSDLKIYEISTGLGYLDTDYFNRLFKKFSGSTPSSYRKTHADGTGRM